MRALLIGALVALGSAASGCHLLIHEALFHHHHPPHVIVHHHRTPRRVYYVDKSPEPAPEPTYTVHKIKTPHEILQERHKAHMKVLKKLFD